MSIAVRRSDDGIGRPSDGKVRVGVLVDQGATVIDFCGPWEAFQDAETADGPGFVLYTVAESRAPVRVTGYGFHRRQGSLVPDEGWGGFEIIPEFAFEEAPAPGVIVMGAQGNHSPGKIEWIRSVAPGADVVLSVCTGAFLLAKTGLLDGLAATTHHSFYDDFERQFPTVELRRGPRYVDNGKVITAGGITSGIDGALRVVERYYGAEVAAGSASEMEYVPTPRPGVVEPVMDAAS
jgi:transcriptional regulator GlxA family with amidase domain